MSTIITNDGSKRIKLRIFAPHAGTFIDQADFRDWTIEITGDPEQPFINGVRFESCKIIADNLKAFTHCLFEDTCTMRIKEMLLVDTSSTPISINSNYVAEGSAVPKIIHSTEEVSDE